MTAAKWVKFSRDIELPDQIEYLMVGTDDLESIEDELSRFSRLKGLHIVCNRLRDLECITSEDINTLTIECKSMTELPCSMSKYPKLTVFCAMSPELHEVEGVFWSGSVLGMLWLRSDQRISLNELNSAPPTLTNLRVEAAALTFPEITSNLSVRQLSVRDITGFDAFDLDMWPELNRFIMAFCMDTAALKYELHKARNLEEMIMRASDSAALFGVLPHTLRSIAASGSGLTDMPTSLRRCTDLEVLDLACNRITRIPEWLSELRLLKRINLVGNPLSHIPKWLAESGVKLLLNSEDFDDNDD